MKHDDHFCFWKIMECVRYRVELSLRLMKIVFRNTSVNKLSIFSRFGDDDPLMSYYEIGNRIGNQTS